MCRLFGFHSVINSQVHSSLVHADNALIAQSNDHPDGWGVVYYRENTPHLIKSINKAVDDHIFQKISGVVSSQTVIAHIRKATQGSLSILNSHPFQYGLWTFAHNGNIKNFHSFKDELINNIDEDLKRFIFGTTDSEILFYLLLSFIKKRTTLSDPDCKIEIIEQASQDLIDLICQFTGPLYGGSTPNPKETHLTFIISTGKLMVGFNGGQKLNYSTYKTKCSERNICKYFSDCCENATNHNSKINHLIFSSENLVGENIWLKMQNGEMISVDSEMTLRSKMLNVVFN